MTSALPTLIDLLAHNAVAHADRPAVIDDGAPQSHTMLYEAVQRQAAALSALGVGQGDRVVLIAGNRAEVLVMLGAVAWLGAMLVPLNLRLSPAEWPSRRATPRRCWPWWTPPARPCGRRPGPRACPACPRRCSARPTGLRSPSPARPPRPRWHGGTRRNSARSCCSPPPWKATRAARCWRSRSSPPRPGRSARCGHSVWTTAGSVCCRCSTRPASASRSRCWPRVAPACCCRASTRPPPWRRWNNTRSP